VTIIKAFPSETLTIIDFSREDPFTVSNWQKMVL